MQISEFIRLVRFEHALMLAIAVFIAETIVLGELPALSTVIALSLLVPVFSEMGSFALNDYLDLESDKVNKRTERPLVRGAISPEFAYRFAWVSLIISTALAFFININAFIIALIFNALAIAYNYKLKDIALIGNAYIGFTMAIPFIFGNLVISPTLHPVAFTLALLGFVSGLAREIVKSTEDMEGDAKARKAKTLPILIGRKNALIIAIVLYVVFIPLTYVPFMYGLNQYASSQLFISAAVIGILTNIYLLLIAIKAKEAVAKEKLKKARKISLISLGLGLVGYLLGAL